MDDSTKARVPRIIFSFVVDVGARFLYDGWHLARSLIEHCGAEPTTIHVHFTAEVDAVPRGVFRELGCSLHEIERFGDGRYCNKIAQIDELRYVDFDIAVLLDTDTIAIADIRPFLRDDAILGKIVDVARPPIHVLDEIAGLAGTARQFSACKTDEGTEITYEGNCNGGFYSIPKAFCSQLSTEWRRWALWLLGNVEPLAKVGHETHVDQVSFWLAISGSDLPFAAASSNVNYFTHFQGEHSYFDDSREIALLHHHHQLNVVGLIEIAPECNSRAQSAVATANRQIGSGFNNRVFWQQRYESFPERGSGVGSRGDNLLYKRRLLEEHGIASAESVLDVGCGDIAVVGDLPLRQYLGVDVSPAALALARRARPDWEFALAPTDPPAAEVVLCFEVLIHQETEAAYRAVIATLCQKTRSVLFVSGFAEDVTAGNRMLFFYEPLEVSLRQTGRFTHIECIGAHTNVAIYRCGVD